MQAEQQNIKEQILDAEIVLVGLGEEFDDIRTFRKDAGYREGKVLLAESEKNYLLPAWQRIFRENEEHREERERLENGLRTLAGLLEGKNYFVVSVSTNGQIRDIPWREDRLVMPCGSDLEKQCGAECRCGVRPLAEADKEMLHAQLQNWRQSLVQGQNAKIPDGLGICEECGEEIGLNNIYHVSYNESGYMEDWQRYKRWLQGSLNHKTLILELGVGMQFPEVIRWPFEKVAFFNQKAYFYRINEKLYQLTEEISEKGCGIAENAIDWLQNLC